MQHCDGVQGMLECWWLPVQCCRTCSQYYRGRRCCRCRWMTRNPRRQRCPGMRWIRTFAIRQGRGPHPHPHPPHTGARHLAPTPPSWRHARHLAAKEGPARGSGAASAAAAAGGHISRRDCQVSLAATGSTIVMCVAVRDRRRRGGTSIVIDRDLVISSAAHARVISYDCTLHERLLVCSHYEN
jgi:hypothetical protein